MCVLLYPRKNPFFLKVEVDATIVLDDLLSEIEGSDYFSYQGSLTTPGCFEVVSWIVMNEPILIGESQVRCLNSHVADALP